MQTVPQILFTTSTIADGNMSFRFGEETEVVKNRQTFIKQLPTPGEQYICMRCDHGEKIIVVNNDTHERHVNAQTQANMLEAEVLVTQTPHLTLMLLTADCLPTAFYDPVTNTIALAHFSRTTIAAGLPTRTIHFLTHTFDINPSNLLVYVGPHIQVESYCFSKPLSEVKPLIAPHLVEHNESICIDLPAAHSAQLIGAGVPKKNIHYSSIDTNASPDHFSHFAHTRHEQKPPGRLATILQLLSTSS
jgi:copper oxidase (laccase) domain-containing protein